jgi:hypothetical protein
LTAFRHEEEEEVVVVAEEESFGFEEMLRNLGSISTGERGA